MPVTFTNSPTSINANRLNKMREELEAMIGSGGGGGGIPEAPLDHKTYSRKDASWVVSPVNTGPPGPPGADGAQGEPGLVWRGAWDSGTTYDTDDAVTFDGSSYRATVPIAPGAVPWHPSAVASLVLDADAISQVDGSAISSWVSTGSNTSYQGQQPTVGQQPVLNKTALNGHGFLHFDGNDYLIVPAVDTGTGGWTMTALVRMTTAASYPMMMSYNPPGGWELRGNGGVGTWQYIAGGGASSANSTINLVGSWHMIAGISTTLLDQIFAYTDGVQDSAGSRPAVVTGQDLWLGQRSDGYAFNGDMACAILVKGNLVDADRQKIEGWMAHQWGVTALLPSGHPYKGLPPLASGSVSDPSGDSRWELLAAKGDTGPQGPPGTGGGGGGGSTILDGLGPPADSLGDVGDYYIDSTGLVMYGPKAAAGLGTAKFATQTVDAPTANSIGNYCIGGHFKMLISGQFTGARYYHVSGSDVNPRKLSIWSAVTHALLGQTALTTENTASSGWLYAPLPAAIPFAANEEFVVSFDNTLGGSFGYKASGGALINDPTEVAYIEGVYVGGFGSYPGTSAGAGISYMVDLEYKPPGTAVWPVAVPGMEEAPTDGQQYARQSSSWSVVTGGSGSSVAFPAHTTTSFTVPVVGATATVTVDNANWIVSGQTIYLENAAGVGVAGAFQVTAKSGNILTLLNPPMAPGGGDMLKSVYDTDGDGYVDQWELPN